MYEALLVVFLIVAIGLVGLIMLQQGKGADMGASFGAGASATLFGSSGSGNFHDPNDGGIGDAVLHHQSGVG
ncbi:Protein-export membrane protein secG [Salmonella enterica subsp. enterica]|uniref:Protein-export membrane protein SecG n=1 Tax=Salmonella enterica I TaxID=59201 RepID=A0A379WKM9_SALET|nr:Protein-export membrane protein secG [Salmonella enterica subsp. enterica]